MSWLVFRLTGSAFVLGVVGFAGQFPSFVIAPVAGVLVDRWSRRRIVLATQILSMLQALLLAGLVLTGLVEVAHIIGLAVGLGIVNGFDIPARQALLVELVDGPDDLANAIALNSSMFNGARLIGPAIAGVLIGLIGEGFVFLANGLSYVAVIASLLAIGAGAGSGRATGRPRIFENLREGVDYAFRFVPIRTVLLLLAFVSLIGMPYVVLLPIVASDVLGGGAATLGYLMSGAGFGALAGALYLASRPTVRGLGRVIAVGGATFGAGLVLLALSHQTWLSVVLLFICGFGVMTFSASINTVLQTLVEDDKRGRIMSLYTMAFMGMAPFGSLFAGAFAERLGVAVTIAVGGVSCIAAAVWFRIRLPSLRTLVRPVYIEKGIIPEVATGIESASELRQRG